MIRSFASPATQDVFDGTATKAARRLCPVAIWRVARRRLDQLNQAEVLEDLRIPPNNRLKKLTKDRSGQHSIRINDQYRVCFQWTDAGPEDVEVTDYH